MRALLSAIFLLVYLCFAFVVVALVIHNTQDVNVHLILWDDVKLPLYIPIAISFAAGLGLGLFYALGASVRRLFSR